MAAQTLLSGCNLTCIRQDRILFEHLHLDVHEGDILQVQGRNGAGKTSLLRILAGLSRPYEGHVRYPQADQEAEQSNILYIGHKQGLKSDLSTQENLDFYQRLHAYPVTPLDALTRLQLDGFEDTSTHHLSAGQQKRNALARLIHAPYNIWIVDEPFSALDTTGITHLEQLFLQHVYQGGCLIFTTHQPSKVQNYEKFRVLDLHKC
tara:strand:+ start:21263 stop:21880 length:618 start_codon:yes stop_codon:yes gene_type:complete